LTTAHEDPLLYSPDMEGRRCYDPFGCLNETAAMYKKPATAYAIPELISEAYSEVLFGSPTPTALKVYGIVTEYRDDRLRTINEMRMF